MFTLNCKGKIFIIETPVVMGIINATPDSFYEGHLSLHIEEIVALAKKMITEGASILDIGGQSTRPGSERITAAEEIKRIIPVIKNIRTAFPQILISADTYHSAVAIAAVQEGADIINDISAGEMDAAMIQTVASLKVPYICMHMKGEPGTMHKNPVYDDVVKEVLDFFIAKTNECKRAGITDVIIDPGFGFGKTISHNFKLLQQLELFKVFEKPVLAGLSRKSTVYRTLNISPQEALNGTTVLNTLAIQNGAAILRVHDVKEAMEVIRLMNAYKV
ncbi:MAG: dihydropteroate synthase [Ferruginibacter sp.]